MFNDFCYHHAGTVAGNDIKRQGCRRDAPNGDPVIWWNDAGTDDDVYRAGAVELARRKKAKIDSDPTKWVRGFYKPFVSQRKKQENKKKAGLR